MIKSMVYKHLLDFTYMFIAYQAKKIAHSGAVPPARMANLWAGVIGPVCRVITENAGGKTEAVSLLPTGDKEVLDIGRDSLHINSLHIIEI